MLPKHWFLLYDLCVCFCCFFLVSCIFILLFHFFLVRNLLLTAFSLCDCWNVLQPSVTPFFLFNLFFSFQTLLQYSCGLNRESRSRGDFLSYAAHAHSLQHTYLSFCWLSCCQALLLLCFLQRKKTAVRSKKSKGSGHVD